MKPLTAEAVKLAQLAADAEAFNAPPVAEEAITLLHAEQIQPDEWERLRRELESVKDLRQRDLQSA